jgi:excisionase family DNA binding protein
MKQKPTTDMADFLTVKEALDKIRIGRTFLYSLFKKKELTKYKIGGRTMVKESELNKIVRACS